MKCFRKSKNKNEKKFEDDSFLQTDEHEVSVQLLCERLKTDPIKGLTTDVAKTNLKQFGENILTPPKDLNPYYRFFVHNFQGADCVAAIGVILCLTNYIIESFANFSAEPDIEKIYVGVTLSMFIVFVGTYSYVIERVSIRLLDGLRTKISNNTCFVIRDGRKQVINVQELTIGDLVEIHCGDRIPADIRVIQTKHCQIDKSSLIPYSPPTIVTSEMTDKNPLSTNNLIFATTFAVAGKCRGIVIKVGDSTVIGHIGRENTLLQRMYTPLIHRFNKVVLLYCFIAGILSLVFTFLVMRLNYKFLDVSTVYITMFIVFVPEKLLICLHTNHILATSRLERMNCFIKHFEGIETLGRCSTICCGVSGVLTESEMKVSHFWLGGNVIDINKMTDEQITSESFGILTRSMHLNLSQHLMSSSEELNRFVQNNIELAIVKYLQQHNCTQESERLYEISFSCARMYQLSIHKVDYDSRFLLVAMGSPEIILSKCSTILMEGEEVKITEEIRKTFNEIMTEMGNLGEKIIGFCEVFLPLAKFPQDFIFDEKISGYPKHGFRFVGMISLQSPLRLSIPASIQTCLSSNIKVIILSGDHLARVTTVAHSAGIISKDTIIQEANVVLENPLDEIPDSSNIAITATGDMLEEMNETELRYILYNYKQIIFTRIRPHQKLIIVKYLQQNGEIVSFTGKSYSDTFALKKSNIGLVPLKSSDMVRNSADVVLVDGSLTSIVDGIQEGRLVFENFRKSICFQLATDLPKIMPFILYALVQIPLPLGAITILCLDIGIDFLSAVSLSYEKPEPHLMNKPPRKSDYLTTGKMILRSYFHIGILETCAGLLVYFVVFASNGFLPSRLVWLRDEFDDKGNDDLQDSFGQEWTFEQRKILEANAHSAYFYGVVLTQIANLLSSRTNSNSLFQQKMNWKLIITIIVEVCIATILVYVNLGWFDVSLKVRNIRWSRILFILPFGIFIIIYDEVRKWFIRHYPIGWTAQRLHYLD